MFTFLHSLKGALGAPNLLITLGAKGALFYQHGDPIRQSAYPVEPVDTTGAGDTFLGAFLAQYSQGQSAERALQFAAGASAIQVTREGAAPAIPDAKEVMAFIKSREAP